MMTLQEFLNQYAPRLEPLDHVRAPKRVLRQLAAHLMDLNESQIFMYPERDVTLVLAKLEQHISEMEEGRPLAHIFGSQPFLNWDFFCDRRALIPRPETEALCEQVIEACDPPPRMILDLCTGSGVLGLALALTFPEASVDLSDLSQEALDLARENANRHKLAPRVNFFLSDLFKDMPGTRYDLIVCNPPYVAHTDEVGQSVLDYEPHMALYSDDDGLADVKTILLQLPERLTPGGYAAFELGHRHEETLSPWLTEHLGQFEWRFTEDPFGVPRYLWVHDRMSPGL